MLNFTGSLCVFLGVEPIGSNTASLASQPVRLALRLLWLAPAFQPPASAAKGSTVTLSLRA
jgi:hypothetical protein